MRIGIPREIKNHEYRVGGTPTLVTALTRSGHEVLVETDAGAALGYSDALYQKAGAVIVADPKEVWASQMVIKVKEPQPAEFPYMHPDLILFCFLHLSPEPDLTLALIKNGVTAIAWETVTDTCGRLPILIPMSEVAGRLSVQAGASALCLASGGKGLLLGGVPGTPPAEVLIIGAGIVGLQAARMAMGLGASVTLSDTNLERLRAVDNGYEGRIRTLFSSPENIASRLPKSDLIIGSVLIPGKLAPKVITRDMLRLLEKGSALVDVAIDQGGCFETSKPTTHAEPTFLKEGIVHYCVANMPGACAKTSTEALMNVITPYTLSLASRGYQRAFAEDPGLLNGLNVYKGSVTNRHVAFDLGYEYTPPESLINLKK